MFNETMHDIETLATTPDAVVVSLGAVKFNLIDTDSYDTIQDDPDRVFYAVLNRDEQVERGRLLCPKTQTWWDKQSREARKVFDAPTRSVKEILLEFNAWVGDAELLWGNGNMFDNVIMRNLYIMYGIKFPIPYWGDMDMRTLVTLNGGDKPAYPIATAHNDLDDAMMQTLQVQHIARELISGK